VRPVSSTPVLRPLGIGEILDTALAVYRRQAFALWRIVAVVIALPSALSGALAVAEQQVSNSSDKSSGSLVTLVILVVVVDWVASLLVTAAAFRLVADAYLGRPTDPSASLRFGLRRLGAVLLLSLAEALVIFVAVLVLVGLGLAIGPAGVAIGFALAIALSLCLVVYWSVMVPVLLGEHRRGFRSIIGSLARSYALVRSRFWRCTGLLVLALLLEGIVAGGISLVIDAIASSSANNTVIFLDHGISTLIADTLVLPFQVAVTTVLYIDLRVRKEGFDVQLLAHSLGPGGAAET
jgi:hypothetical protein